MKKQIMKLKLKKMGLKSAHYSSAFAPAIALSGASGSGIIAGSIASFSIASPVLGAFITMVGMFLLVPLAFLLLWLLGKAGFNRAYEKINNDEDIIRKDGLEAKLEKKRIKDAFKDKQKELKRELKKLKPTAQNEKKMITMADTIAGINATDKALELENQRLREEKANREAAPVTQVINVTPEDARRIATAQVEQPKDISIPYIQHKQEDIQEPVTIGIVNTMEKVDE